MSVNQDILEEYKASLADRYEPIELCELLIDHFDLTIWDVIDIFGDDRLMELHRR